MRLVPVIVPIFHSAPRVHPNQGTERKIYRCSIGGCPVVANGPSESVISKKQRKRDGIRHYGETER
jgi:hypothetical protein